MFHWKKWAKIFHQALHIPYKTYPLSNYQKKKMYPFSFSPTVDFPIQWKVKLMNITCYLVLFQSKKFANHYFFFSIHPRSSLQLLLPHHLSISSRIALKRPMEGSFWVSNSWRIDFVGLSFCSSHQMLSLSRPTFSASKRKSFQDNWRNVSSFIQILL